jgi:hypothetical protein
VIRPTGKQGSYGGSDEPGQGSLPILFECVQDLLLFDAKTRGNPSVEMFSTYFAGVKFKISGAVVAHG